MSDSKSRIHNALDRFRDLVGKAEAKLSNLPASRHSHCYIEVTKDLGEGSPHFLVYRYIDGDECETICLVDMRDASGADDIQTCDSAVWVVAVQSLKLALADLSEIDQNGAWTFNNSRTMPPLANSPSIA